MAKMKKILCVVWVLVLVFGLCACAASNPIGVQLGSNTTTTVQPGIDPTVPTTQPVPPSSSTQAEKPEPEVPYFDLSLMTEVRKAEIEAAWKTQFGHLIEWEAYFPTHDRFYGDFGTCVVILSPGVATAQHTIEVAGYAFTYSNSFVLYVYADGAFYKIQEAYDNGIVTQEQIGMVHTYHVNYVDYIDYE